MAETRPSAIVRSPLDPDVLVKDATTVELLTTCMERLNRDRENNAAAVARELSTAITHIEDAITRTNKAHYRARGVYAITDAER